MGREPEGVTAACLEYRLGWELEGNAFQVESESPDPFLDGVCQMTLGTWTWGKARGCEGQSGLVVFAHL